MLKQCRVSELWQLKVCTCNEDCLYRKLIVPTVVTSLLRIPILSMLLCMCVGLGFGGRDGRAQKKTYTSCNTAINSRQIAEITQLRKFDTPLRLI